jgi:hypothetical protein
MKGGIIPLIPILCKAAWNKGLKPLVPCRVDSVQAQVELVLLHPLFFILPTNTCPHPPAPHLLRAGSFLP